MIQPPLPPKPPVFNTSMQSELQKVLGERQQLQGVKQKYSTYEKPVAPKKKVYTSGSTEELNT